MKILKEGKLDLHERVKTCEKCDTVFQYNDVDTLPIRYPINFIHVKCPMCEMLIEDVDFLTLKDWQTKEFVDNL